jgi:hypothetical protein
MAPQEIDTEALKAMTEVRLPQAKLRPGNTTLGQSVGPSGKADPGTIPHRDIPHQEFPRIVYLHPKKPFRKMFLPYDGHGNKEWKWVANQARELVVASEEELKKALTAGYQKKHYVVPPVPLEDPEEEAVDAK